MNKHTIIAVVGKKRSGKDSAGDYLVSNWRVNRAQKLAHPIKQIGMMLFGWTEDMVEGNDYDREQMIPELGMSVRQFLQECGSLFKYNLSEILPNYGKKVGPRVWAKVLVRWIKAQPYGAYVVTDVRFPEEVEELKANFDTVIVLKMISDRSPDDEHVSETALERIPYDHCIVNNGWGTYAMLENDLSKFMQKYQDVLL